MTDFHVEVVTVDEVRVHPDADNLDIVQIRGFPVVCRKGEYRIGDKTVYVPVESVVPATDARWDFLGGHYRIKPKRIRGIMSLGLLTPADSTWEVGQDVSNELGITKYVPSICRNEGSAEKDPGFIPVYTDLESIRRWPNVIQPGEQVCITEKIHGENGRIAHDNHRYWMGSHTNIRKDDGNCKWWEVYYNSTLSRIRDFPHFVFYFELYGRNKKFDYGTSRQYRYAVFDIFDIRAGQYVDFIRFISITKQLELLVAPILYTGPWKEDLISFAEGPTTLNNAKHVREGIVVKPFIERFDERVGRVILKYAGEGYLLAKKE